MKIKGNIQESNESQYQNLANRNHNQRYMHNAAKENEYITPYDGEDSMSARSARPTSILLQSLVLQHDQGRKRLDLNALQTLIECRLREDERAFNTLIELKHQLINSLTLVEMSLKTHDSNVHKKSSFRRKIFACLGYSK